MVLIGMAFNPFNGFMVDHEAVAFWPKPDCAFYWKKSSMSGVYFRT